MVTIFPFKAITPNPKLINEVSTRSINTYSSAQIQELHQNPHSFVHVIQPDYEEEDTSKANTLDRFLKINDRFQEFIKEEKFIQEDLPVLFIYQQRIGERSYTGIIAGASTHDYENGTIKKHEETLAKRELIFTEYLKTCGFNAEPVLLAHPYHEGIKQIISEEITSSPYHQFTSEDAILHTMWRINDTNKIKRIQQYFKEIACIYIADGHHRSASSYLLSKETKEDFILSYFISEKEIDIYDFNRVVKDLNFLTKEDFFNQLSNDFEISLRDEDLCKPSKNGEISVYIDHHFYSLTFKHNKEALAIDKQLDAQILTDYILSPILGIHDLKTDDRIDFVTGKNGLTSLKDLVDSGKYTIGFSLFPISYQELTDIADNNLIMPPKSTWIEPKLRTGLTIYKFQDV